MERDISFRALIGRTFALIASDIGAVLLAFIGIVLFSTALDVAMPNGGNLLGLPILVVQYYTIRRLVDRVGLRSANRHAGFGSFFVLGIITGLPILLGFAALIIPGLYLSARWAMANAALLAEDDGVGGAARRAWAGSAGHIVPIMLTQLVLALPLIAALAMMIGAGFFDGVAASNGDESAAIDPTAIYGVNFAFNVLVTAWQISGWYFCVAAYELIIGKPSAALAAVFE